MLNRIRRVTADRVTTALVVLIILLVLLTITAQLAIYHGRQMERAEAAAKLADAEARAQRLGNMLSVAQTQIEHLAIVQALTRCESSNRHEGVWGDGGKSYGRWQFQEASFDYLADRAGLSGLDWQDARDQTIVGAWALTNGYGGWWTCWKKITKTEKETRQ